MFWLYTAVSILGVIALFNGWLAFAAYLRYRKMDAQEREIDQLLWEIEVWDGRVPPGLDKESDEAR